MISFKEFTTSLDRVVDHAEAMHLVGVSKSHISRLEKSGQFPRRIKLGSRRVGWSLHEIQQWLEEKKATRDVNDMNKEI